MKRRKIAHDLLGGKCRNCGYKEHIQALQIDHIEPELRERDTWNSYKVVSKLARGIIGTEGLQLLCANCHAIKTFEDRKKFKSFKD